MYLLDPFILQNFKKFLEPIQSYEDVPFSGPKWLTCPEQLFFFCTNHYYYFHLFIHPFHCAKFKKILTADPELWGCTIFGPKMVYLPQFFLEKNINIIFIYLLARFIMQKILAADPELRGCAILGHKMAHLLKWKFFQKTC